MRAAGAIGAMLALALGAVPAAAVEPGARLVVERVGDATRLDAELPGVLLAALALPAGAGFDPPAVLLLVGGKADADAPAALYRLDPRGDGVLELLAAGLPAGAKALEVVEREGSAAPEVVLGRLGDLFSLGPLDRLGESTPPRLVLSHAGFDLRSLHPAPLRVARAGRRVLAAAEAGTLRRWSPAGDGWAVAAELALPVAAVRRPAGLALRSPPVREVAWSDGAAPLYAAGPEAHGKRRLRTLLLGPDGERTEAWSRLPAVEAVEQSWVKPVDGRAVLFVAAQSAERVGIFEKRRLRVFPLADDRTRQGRLPSFAVETASRRWFELGLEIADLDGDGRDDLVLLQPEGMGGGDLLLTVYPGLGGGRFLQRPARTKLDLEARQFAFAEDVTGDGYPDLVVLAADALHVYPGDPRRRRVVDKHPRWSVPVAAGERAPVSVEVGGGGSDGERPPNDEHSAAREAVEVVDLDGDGRAEVLLSIADEDGRGRFVVARFDAG